MAKSHQNKLSASMFATHNAPQPTRLYGHTILDDIEVNFGPTELLGRFFATAYRAALDLEVALSFSTFDELVEINSANRSSWAPLVPVLDPAFHRLSSSNSFCVVARTKNGRPIATHAVRLFEWSSTNFIDQAQSLAMFYSDPVTMKNDGEHCSLTMTNAKQITGRVAYSGAAWVHPDFRGRGLTAIVPKVAKAYALTSWKPDFTASLMAESVYNAGFFKRFAYQNIDWEGHWTNSPLSPLGNLRVAVVWMDEPHLIRDLEAFCSRANAEVDNIGRRRNTN